MLAVGSVVGRMVMRRIIDAGAVIVRDFSFVMPWSQAKRGGDGGKTVHRYGQHQHRHHEQTRSDHAISPLQQ